MKRDLTSAIDDKKKAELDAMQKQVTDAQYDVNELQAIVDSLSAKSSQFTLFLSQAQDSQNTALNNLTMGQDALASVSGVAKSTKLAVKQTEKATLTGNVVSVEMANMINKLVYTIEFVDKVAQQVSNQKASNPLISAQLVSFLTKANSDANAAFASALTALQSCYAADATLKEASKVTVLENIQAHTLKATMEHKAGDVPSSEVSDKWVISHQVDGLLPLLTKRYQASQTAYQVALSDNNAVTAELNTAQKQLATATTELASLQAGLAAATAAAYAA